MYCYRISNAELLHQRWQVETVTNKTETCQKGRRSKTGTNAVKMATSQVIPATTIGHFGVKTATTFGQNDYFRAKLLCNSFRQNGEDFVSQKR